MIYLFDKVYQIALMLIFILVFVILVLAGCFIMSQKKRKGRKEEDEYYQHLERYDSQEYIDDLDDIIDDMIVIDGHKKFIGAIRCNGYDFHSASSAQQASTQSGYIEFLRAADGPVTSRQNFVRMSMDSTHIMYAQRYEEIERELFHKAADRDNIVERLNIVRGIDLVTEDVLLKEAEKIQEEIGKLEWRRMHVKEQMDFMGMVCDESLMEPDVEQTYLFEWEFDPGQYNMELSEEDIHKKAIEELGGKARRMISALGQANVRAYRCSTEELIEMFYQQSHPLSAMEFKMPDIVNSPFFNFVASSKDFKTKRENAYKDAVLSEGMRMVQKVEEGVFDNQKNTDEEVTA